MMKHPPDASPIVRGYAAFYCEYEEVFAPWMGRFADDLFSLEAKDSDRARLLQWALCGLVWHLDNESAYRMGWIGRNVKEIRQPKYEESFTTDWNQLKKDLHKIKIL